jgi:hypothetical protein
MMIEWKPISSSDGYEVSSDGQIRSYFVMGSRSKRRATPTLLKQRFASNGYAIIDLKRLNRSKSSYLVHRLVAEAFLDNPNGLPHVNHRNGNKLDNSVSNLEWCTPLDNVRHQIDVLGQSMRRNHKLTLEQASEIKGAEGNIYLTAARYGVSAATVSRIKNGLIWKDANCNPGF